MFNEVNLRESTQAAPAPTFAEPVEGQPATEGSGRMRVPGRPSMLYGAALWKLACLVARFGPEGAVRRAAAGAMGAYQRVCPGRREVVVQNLLPALNGDLAAASRAADGLFRQFAFKLVDLWRFEAGLPVAHQFLALHGRDRYTEAVNSKRGVLLLTPHLGNWEFGAPLLAHHGFKLTVITLVEPGHGLTEMRQRARARWGIDTVVIGRDPFAFVEVIRLLESGATVALLVDRPPRSSAVEVKLFGRRFMASIAAAELARATGCELLPVYLTRQGDGYGAHILPRVEYERASLRDRGARQALTQRVMEGFEPVIREHLEQWYHFVPVWR